MNNNECIGFIRCTKCGKIYHVDGNGLNQEHSSFCCNICGNNFDVPFFANCLKCNKIVGLDNSTAFNLIFDNMVDLIKSPKSFLGFLPRLVDDIPSANGWGKCPFCDTTYLRCPRCSQLVEVKHKMGVNEIIRCLNCGQNMRHP